MCGSGVRNVPTRFSNARPRNPARRAGFVARRRPAADDRRVGPERNLRGTVGRLSDHGRERGEPQKPRTGRHGRFRCRLPGPAVARFATDYDHQRGHAAGGPPRPGIPLPADAQENRPTDDPRPHARGRRQNPQGSGGTVDRAAPDRSGPGGRRAGGRSPDGLSHAAVHRDFVGFHQATAVLAVRPRSTFHAKNAAHVANPLAQGPGPARRTVAERGLATVGEGIDQPRRRGLRHQRFGAANDLFHFRRKQHLGLSPYTENGASPRCPRAGGEILPLRLPAKLHGEANRPDWSCRRQLAGHFCRARGRRGAAGGPRNLRRLEAARDRGEGRAQGRPARLLRGGDRALSDCGRPDAAAVEGGRPAHVHPHAPRFGLAGRGQSPRVEQIAGDRRAFQGVRGHAEKRDRRGPLCLLAPPAGRRRRTLSGRAGGLFRRRSGAL